MRFSEDRIEKLTCSDGLVREIHIWEHEAPGSVFLILHGILDHGGNYMNLGIYLKAHGFAAVAPDQHGHDRKRKAHVPGFDVFLDDLELIYAWVKDNYQNVPVFILGHSMGGLIVSHYGIRRYQEDPQVKGFILSAPAYKNSLKVSKLLIKFSGILSMLVPKMTAPVEDLRPYVTHDEAEYKRMRDDERDGIQATKMSFRLGNEYLKAQEWIPEHISEWKYPMLAILPGDDKLINTEFTRELLSKVKDGLVTEIFYPGNYHESFNELNREEVFSRIVDWCGTRLR
jgi:lysophospholipase